MKKVRLIAYAPTKERRKFLISNIKHYEEFFSIEEVFNIFSEYLCDSLTCRKKGINMNKTNKLELYHANLRFYYNEI